MPVWQKASILSLTVDQQDQPHCGTPPPPSKEGEGGWISSKIFKRGGASEDVNFQKEIEEKDGVRFF